ncbi:MAG: GH3 auxin-responsive promoter [Sphingobacteriales bacterium]|nr:MAG: GH3 auxin-responsive promoter [Sphingobacteriales bacterium]
MASIGIIIKNGLGLTKKLPKQKRKPFESQQKVLHKLLRRAQFTVFGQEYQFSKVLKSDDLIKAFQQEVPIHNYESIFKWWNMTLQGETSVCWPGKVDYFALSSGTSTGSSKFIPVTRSMLKAIQRASIKQILSLAYCDLPEEFFTKDILMLGGSTSLDYNGIYYAGDLSGITTKTMPFWFQPYYKPGKDISKTRNWQEKLDYIVKEAHKWDVGAIAGSPSWFQILLERIVKHNNAKTIHDVWPNLQVFTHGAVAFEPYRKSFEALLARPLIYMETYLASEGFIAYQANPKSEGMKLLTGNGIFFEFIPFNDKNIDGDGNVLENAKTLTINEVEEGVEYILVMSTVAGAWRYIIGDVIKFTSVKNYEIRITGRTKHYISLCGEHLSVDNMNQAIEMLSDELNIKVKEFAVSGVQNGNEYGHHWFISIDGDVDKNTLIKKLDENLGKVNDDYCVERKHVLKGLYLDIIPNELFLGWLKQQGREGAQIKFPRVLKKEQLKSWKEYLAANGFTSES